MIKFSYTILYVPDVTATISFYEKAFDLKRKFITPDNSYGELDTGDTTLSFASIPQANSNLKSGFVVGNLKDKPLGFEIAFATNEVEKVYRKAVKAGAIPETEATVKPHGQTVAYVRDPNGFLIEICTPIV
ncbi:MAG TPA: VOC family protein [Chryseolinea sp.]|nr:VOC family protein [Chryseolinea sp.]